LGEEAYGGLHFNNFRIIGYVDCKIATLDQGLQKIGNGLLDMRMLIYYKNPSIWDTLDIMGLKFFLWCFPTG
jgi:hypothetical protein